MEPVMWQLLLNLLGGPVINGFLNAYKAKLALEGNADKLRENLGIKELDLQSREMELQTQLRIAQIGKWYEPEHILGYTVAIYFAKVIIWDKVLALGSTDALHGDVGSWAGMIVLSYFGKRGVENVVRIWKAR
jgi:hypothetical protein